MSLSKQEALRLAKVSVSEDVTTILHMSTIARLWGGMGQVYRVSCSCGSSKESDSYTGKEDFCVKYMAPQRLSLGNAAVSLGDQRKLDSYIVEATFYRDYSTELIDQGVGLAKCLHVEQSNSNDDNHKTILCLSLLQNVPDNNKYYQNTLEWLAHFHASTWQRDAIGLQEVGTYWHLDTRPSEWESMSDGNGWEGRLKLAARAIDEALKVTDIQCWVHGDAKYANVMWDEQHQQVAMCDFQYVGRGCPAKDLAYFLCSNNVSDDDEYVDMYFELLSSKLKHRAPSRKDFDVVLELSYCDYLRFMCGWGQWGSDITDRVKTTLDKIDGGRKLVSGEAYREAIKEFMWN